MILKPSVAAIRRVSVITAPLVAAATLYLLLTGRATLAAVIATIGIALLAVLLAQNHHQTTRAQRRADQLKADLDAAYRDPVTGLAVRTVAEQHLTDTAGTDVTVALVDVDDMHGINAAHHHDGGDLVLTAVADRLRHAAEPGDLVARLGGDEFVVITHRDPHALARALATAPAPPVALGPTRVPVNVSIGICQVPGGDPHTALGCADRAMFTAKRRRSGIEHYDSDRDGVPLSHGVRPPVRHRDRRATRRTCGDA